MTSTVNTDMTWVVCGRCSGTGNHGPVSIHGGKCFGCTDASGISTGGHWVDKAVAKRRAAASARRGAAREAREAGRLAAFAARTDAAVAALAIVGFTNARELMKGSDMALSYAAQDAVFAVRDNATNPVTAFAAFTAKVATFTTN